MINGPEIMVRDNAGWFLEDNMTAGDIVVEDHSDNGTGQDVAEDRRLIYPDAGLLGELDEQDY